MQSYLGRITSTECPFSMMARQSAVTTSPMPPTLAIGAISTATCTIRSFGLLPLAPFVFMW